MITTPHIRGLPLQIKGATFVIMKEKDIRKQQEKEAALARLASQESASQKHRDIKNNFAQSALDDFNAIDVVASQFQIPHDQARTLRDRMIAHLQESELTVNFQVSKLFSTTAVSGGIMNAWERPPDPNNPGYLPTRNRAEERLFNYSSRANAPQEMINRSKRFGDYNNNNNFKPSMRPKYGALNYTRFRYGAVSSALYGRSYFTLKDELKHNCTFTGSDSFRYASDPSGGDKAGTFTEMNRVIINMERRMRQDLNTMVNSPWASIRPTHYIEAQIHGEIWFNRDVKRMNVDYQELDMNPHLRELVVQFAQKNKIPLKYI